MSDDIDFELPGPPYEHIAVKPRTFRAFWSVKRDFSFYSADDLLRDLIRKAYPHYAIDL